MQAITSYFDEERRHGPRPRPVRGQGAGSRKYDVLTALATAGLSGSSGEATSALRLIAVITARYDWSRDSVAIGQEELARLWGTSLRTAKRETKRLTTTGVLVCLAPGVRGRVGVYRLDPAALRRLTERAWPRVGADFADRMAAQLGVEPPASPVRSETARHGDHPAGNGGGEEPEPATEVGGGAAWIRVQRRLLALDPAAHAAWYSRLSFRCQEGQGVRIRAPSRFTASYVETHLAIPLGRAVAEVFGETAKVVLETDS
jgi:hypothetical protein